MDLTVFDETEIRTMFTDMLQNMNESKKQIFVDHYGSIEAWEQQYDFVAKQLYQVKDAEPLLMDIAKGYQENGELITLDSFLPLLCPPSDNNIVTIMIILKDIRI